MISSRGQANIIAAIGMIVATILAIMNAFAYINSVGLSSKIYVTAENSIYQTLAAKDYATQQLAYDFDKAQLMDGFLLRPSGGITPSGQFVPTLNCGYINTSNTLSFFPVPHIYYWRNLAGDTCLPNNQELEAGLLNLLDQPQYSTLQNSSGITSILDFNFTQPSTCTGSCKQLYFANFSAPYLKDWYKFQFNSSDNIITIYNINGSLTVTPGGSILNGTLGQQFSLEGYSFSFGAEQNVVDSVLNQFADTSFFSTFSSFGLALSGSAQYSVVTMPSGQDAIILYNPLPSSKDFYLIPIVNPSADNIYGASGGTSFFSVTQINGDTCTPVSGATGVGYSCSQAGQIIPLQNNTVFSFDGMQFNSTFFGTSNPIATLVPVGSVIIGIQPQFVYYKYIINRFDLSGPQNLLFPNGNILHVSLALFPLYYPQVCVSENEIQFTVQNCLSLTTSIGAQDYLSNLLQLAIAFVNQSFPISSQKIQGFPQYAIYNYIMYTSHAVNLKTVSVAGKPKYDWYSAMILAFGSITQGTASLINQISCAATPYFGTTIYNCGKTPSCLNTCRSVLTNALQSNIQNLFNYQIPTEVSFLAATPFDVNVLNLSINAREDTSCPAYYSNNTGSPISAQNYSIDSYYAYTPAQQSHYEVYVSEGSHGAMLLSANGEFAKNITSINNSYSLAGASNIDYVYATHNPNYNSNLSIIDGTINSQVYSLSTSYSDSAYYVSQSVLGNPYKYIYVVNGTGIQVFNATGGAYITTIYGAFTPDGAVVNSNGTKVYVINSTQNGIDVISTYSNSIISKINVAGLSVNGLTCNQPYAYINQVLISSDGKFLYLLGDICDWNNDVFVLNMSSGLVIANISAVPSGVVPTAPTAMSMTLNVQLNRLYVYSAMPLYYVQGNPNLKTNLSSFISIISLYNFTNFDSIYLPPNTSYLRNTFTHLYPPGFPGGSNNMGVSPDGSLLYIALVNKNVTVIDTYDNQKLFNVKLYGTSPYGSLVVMPNESAQGGSETLGVPVSLNFGYQNSLDLLPTETCGMQNSIYNTCYPGFSNVLVAQNYTFACCNSIIPRPLLNTTCTADLFTNNAGAESAITSNGGQCTTKTVGSNTYYNCTYSFNVFNQPSEYLRWLTQSNSCPSNITVGGYKFSVGNGQSSPNFYQMISDIGGGAIVSADNPYNWSIGAFSGKLNLPSDFALDAGIYLAGPAPMMNVILSSNSIILGGEKFEYVQFNGYNDNNGLYNYSGNLLSQSSSETTPNILDNIEIDNYCSGGTCYLKSSLNGKKDLQYSASPGFLSTFGSSPQFIGFSTDQYPSNDSVSYAFARYYINGYNAVRFAAQEKPAFLLNNKISSVLSTYNDTYFNQYVMNTSVSLSQDYQVELILGADFNSSVFAADGLNPVTSVKIVGIFGSKILGTITKELYWWNQTQIQPGGVIWVNVTNSMPSSIYILYGLGASNRDKYQNNGAAVFPMFYSNSSASDKFNYVNYNSGSATATSGTLKLTSQYPIVPFIYSSTQSTFSSEFACVYKSQTNPSQVGKIIMFNATYSIPSQQINIGNLYGIYNPLYPDLVATWPLQKYTGWT